MNCAQARRAHLAHGKPEAAQVVLWQSWQGWVSPQLSQAEACCSLLLVAAVAAVAQQWAPGW